MWLALLSTLFVASAHAQDIASLLKALDDPDWELRFYAIRQLGEMKGQAREAVPRISAILEDANYQLRDEALRALANIQGAEALSMLIASLNDPSEVVRGSACMALGELGPVAEKAVPQLAARLEDTDVRVQGFATTALVTIEGSEAIRAVRQRMPALVRQLGSVSPSERGSAAFLLGTMRQEAAEAVDELIRLLDDPDGYARSEAVIALESIGTPKALSAVRKPGAIAKQEQ